MTLPRAFSVSDAFDRHGSELLGFAINSLRDRPLAEDCVQEAMVRAWNARDRFDPARASERTWLFAILRNVIVDAVRARARQPVAALADDQVDVAADVADPLERLALAEGLAKLSDEHRAVVSTTTAGDVEIELLDPAYGIAPGQAAVIYDGTRVVGSATITTTQRVPA